MQTSSKRERGEQNPAYVSMERSLQNNRRKHCSCRFLDCEQSLSKRWPAWTNVLLISHWLADSPFLLSAENYPHILIKVRGFRKSSSHPETQQLIMIVPFVEFSSSIRTNRPFLWKEPPEVLAMVHCFVRCCGHFPFTGHLSLCATCQRIGRVFAAVSVQ